jgi:hypothetical protein
MIIDVVLFLCVQNSVLVSLHISFVYNYDGVVSAILSAAACVSSSLLHSWPLIWEDWFWGIVVVGICTLRISRSCILKNLSGYIVSCLVRLVPLLIVVTTAAGTIIFICWAWSRRSQVLLLCTIHLQLLFSTESLKLIFIPYIIVVLLYYILAKSIVLWLFNFFTALLIIWLFISIYTLILFLYSFG